MMLDVQQLLEQSLPKPHKRQCQCSVHKKWPDVNISNLGDLSNSDKHEDILQSLLLKYPIQPVENSEEFSHQLLNLENINKHFETSLKNYDGLLQMQAMFFKRMKNEITITTQDNEGTTSTPETPKAKTAALELNQLISTIKALSCQHESRMTRAKQLKESLTLLKTYESKVQSYRILPSNEDDIKKKIDELKMKHKEIQESMMRDVR